MVEKKVEKQEEIKKELELFEVVDVTTQTAPMIKNNLTDEHLDIHSAISLILNILIKLDKRV